VSHPGTYNANPLSAAAGVTCLSLIADGEAQRQAARTAEALAQAMNDVFIEESAAGAVYGVSSMLHIALGMPEQPPDGYTWGWRALPRPVPPVAPEASLALRLGMLNEGVDLMGGGMMVSAVHTDDDVDRTVEAFRATLRAMKAERLV
jgi:glutamate-1-semialdehyde 2,1-aminomutase